MKIKATLTVTLVKVFSSEDEIPQELQGKDTNELEKHILDNKEELESELIAFTEFDRAEINTIKVEEVEE